MNLKKLFSFKVMVMCLKRSVQCKNWKVTKFLLRVNQYFSWLRLLHIIPTCRLRRSTEILLALATTFAQYSSSYHSARFHFCALSSRLTWMHNCKLCCELHQQLCQISLQRKIWLRFFLGYASMAARAAHSSSNVIKSVRWIYCRMSAQKISNELHFLLYTYRLVSIWFVSGPERYAIRLRRTASIYASLWSRYTFTAKYTVQGGYSEYMTTKVTLEV